KAFMAASAIEPAARNIPRWAKVLNPCVVICHVCSGVPRVEVAADNWAVGTTQLTSATSVDPIKILSVGIYGEISSDKYFPSNSEPSPSYPKPLETSK